MKPYIQTKYVLSITPKDGRPHNSNHQNWHGREAGIIDVTIGQRGWLFYKSDEEDEDYGWGNVSIPWHRIHLSIVENVEEDDNGNIHITTNNTYYNLLKVNLTE